MTDRQPRIAKPQLPAAIGTPEPAPAPEPAAPETERVTTSIRARKTIEDEPTVQMNFRVPISLRDRIRTHWRTTGESITDLLIRGAEAALDAEEADRARR